MSAGMGRAHSPAMFQSEHYHRNRLDTHCRMDLVYCVGNPEKGNLRDIYLKGGVEGRGGVRRE